MVENNFLYAAVGGTPFLLSIIFYLLSNYLTKIPPHLAVRGLKFNFYCSFALIAASMARAASLPAPMARMTVAAPVTASPPA